MPETRLLACLLSRHHHLSEAAQQMLLQQTDAAAGPCLHEHSKLLLHGIVCEAHGFIQVIHFAYHFITRNSNFSRVPISHNRIACVDVALEKRSRL